MQYTAPKKIMEDIPVEGDAAEQVRAGSAAAGCRAVCLLAYACWHPMGLVGLPDLLGSSTKWRFATAPIASTHLW
jgi:hypothetical protein